MKHVCVAIDGPSGAGKSTIARAVAKELGFIYVDTGALYRTIGLAVLRRGFDARNADEVISAIPEISVELRYQAGIQRVFLNDEDVTDLIRTPQISTFASRVSSIPMVRAFLLDTQRNIAARNSVIMDGRDIGTVILPHADVKIFLTASAEKRALRRYSEMCEKEENITVDQVLADMARRDELDAARDIAPLKQAPDATLVDTTDLTLEQSIQTILQIIRKCDQV